MDYSSNFLINKMKCQKCVRLQSILDEINKVKLIKEKLIGELNAQIDEFKSKVKVCDSN
jgi:hypothetical protein